MARQRQHTPPEGTIYQEGRKWLAELRWQPPVGDLIRKKFSGHSEEEVAARMDRYVLGLLAGRNDEASGNADSQALLDEAIRSIIAVDERTKRINGRLQELLSLVTDIYEALTEPRQDNSVSAVVEANVEAASVADHVSDEALPESELAAVLDAHGVSLDFTNPASSTRTRSIQTLYRLLERGKLDDALDEAKRHRWPLTGRNLTRAASRRP